MQLPEDHWYIPNILSDLKHQSDSRPSADHISRFENLTRIIILILSQLGEVLLLIPSVSHVLVCGALGGPN